MPSEVKLSGVGEPNAILSLSESKDIFELVIAVLVISHPPILPEVAVILPDRSTLEG